MHHILHIRSFSSQSARKSLDPLCWLGHNRRLRCLLLKALLSSIVSSPRLQDLLSWYNLLYTENAANVFSSVSVRNQNWVCRLLTEGLDLWDVLWGLWTCLIRAVGGMWLEKGKVKKEDGQETSTWHNMQEQWGSDYAELKGIAKNRGQWFDMIRWLQQQFQDWLVWSWWWWWLWFWRRWRSSL